MALPEVYPNTSPPSEPNSKLGNYASGQALRQTDFLLSSQLSQNAQTSQVSRDEMNLAEFPLTVLSTRSNPSVKTLEFADSQRLRSGEIIERKWIITAADKFGLPTATDDDVALGLMRLTMDQGFQDRKVYFTRYELLKALRWTTEGRSYSRLTKSLDRLSGVRIRATNSFFDNTSKAYITRNFGIIDAYEIIDERASRVQKIGREKKSYFIWSEALFNSFKAGFIKKIDLDYYFSLKSSVSRRLYRYLDKHFYYRSVVEKPLMVLAFEKIGISRNYKFVSSLRQQIEPAAEELVQTGFLSGYEFSGKGETALVRFYSRDYAVAGAKRLDEKDSSRTRTENSPEHKKTQIIEALVSRGISIKQARRLVEGKSPSACELIDQIIPYYDYLVETKDRRVSKNRIGFLYRAVESPEKFAVPREFKERFGDSASVEASSRLVRKRPEHRIFRAQKAPPREIPTASSHNSEDENYRRYLKFIDCELANNPAQLSRPEVETIFRQVEAKMNCLKPVLSPEKFQAVIESCVRDEIARILELPDYQKWLASQ